MKKRLLLFALPAIAGSLFVLSAFSSPGKKPDEKSIESFSRALFRVLREADKAGFKKLMIDKTDISRIIAASNLPDSIKKEMAEEGERDIERMQQNMIDDFYFQIQTDEAAQIKKWLWVDFDYELGMENKIYSLRLTTWARDGQTEYPVQLPFAIWVPGKGWKMATSFHISAAGRPRFRSRKSEEEELRKLADSLRMDSIYRADMAFMEQIRIDSARKADSVLKEEMIRMMRADSIRKDSLMRAKKNPKKPK